MHWFVELFVGWVAANRYSNQISKRKKRKEFPDKQLTFLIVVLQILPMTNKQMSTVMRLAAIYNILWGAWVVLFPHSFFSWMDMEPLAYPTIWQGTGMIVGVYGLGYWWSSYDPLRHWPIILVGFLGKIFGPVGYVMNVAQDMIDPKFGYLLITNDLIWWIPFFLILRKVHFTAKWKLTDEKS